MRNSPLCNLKPDEFNKVITSDRFSDVIKHDNRSKGNARGRGSKPYPLEDIKVHPDATIAYRHNKSFQENKAYWIEQGYPEDKANALAS